MLKSILLQVVLCLTISSAWACPGPQSEVAQEHDASVLFEGRPVSYELGPSGGVVGVTSQGGTVAKVGFEVVRTIRGTNQKQWLAIMRGSGLPKDLPAFKKKFGALIKVGLRDFKIDPGKMPAGYGGLLFVVDAACSMNGEDWLLRPVAP
jgi:hypothetical protein